MSIAYRLGKRMTDILFGIVLLLPCILVLLTLGPALAWQLGSWRILFLQVRPGLDARPFRIFKLKTFLDRYDATGLPLPDAKRRFPLGNWLRRTHWDELPQALNLLNGTMSLVGPRPLLMEYLPLYTPEQALRHQVKPGLLSPTVLAGGNALDWETRLQMDAEYAQRASFATDLKVLFSAILLQFTRPVPGQTGGHEIVAERFQGATAQGRAQEV